MGATPQSEGRLHDARVYVPIAQIEPMGRTTGTQHDFGLAGFCTMEDLAWIAEDRISATQADNDTFKKVNEEH